MRLKQSVKQPVPATRAAATTALWKRAISLAMAVSMAYPSVAPTAALATRAKTDRVGGYTLTSGRVKVTAAPDIDAAAGILVAPDGRAVWARNEKKRRAMASTTKLMTALLVLEHGDLDRVVTVSSRASKVDYATGLQPGERVSARRLLEMALVASSNDAAYALGEDIGRTMPGFVKQMNARARTLGLKNTRYLNAHGLDARGHYSTAADLAVLTRALVDEPEYRRIVRMRSVMMPAHKKRARENLKATDQLLGKYAGLTGGKTGFTDDAKYSFVATAERDGVTLTAVILGAGSNAARFHQTARLFDWGFKNLSMQELGAAGEIVGRVPLSENPSRTVPVRVEESASKVVFALDGEVSREASLPARIGMPVFEGQRMGELRLVQGERTLAVLPAVAATSVVSAEETVALVPVDDYVDRSVLARAAAVTRHLPRFDTTKPVRRRVDVSPSAPAPIEKGDELGQIVYYQGNEVIARVPVIAAETVERPGFARAIGTAFQRGWRKVTGRPTRAELRVLGT